MTATFSEAVQSGTIGFTLKNASGATIASTTSYNAANNTVTLTPTAALAYSTAYTATLSGAKDAAGNTMASRSWSFTTAAAPVTAPSSSIWSGSAKPSATANDANPVELGVKFYSDVDGTITGLRFYKASTRSGTHVANLWSSAGALLATATFTSTAAAGWQEVKFSTPVAVKAGATYVASYYSNQGSYAADSKYFGSQYNSGSLHVPANGGVFAYGSRSSFPNQTFNGNNYWVDVAFSASGSPPAPGDTTAPTVTATSPASATGVAVGASVTATFSEAVQSGTIGFTLKNSAGATIASTTSYNAANNTVTLKPTAALAYSTAYTVTLSGAKDAAGNTMASRSWSFTTAAQVGVDITSPTVTATNPTGNATSVPVGIGLTVTFSESLATSTVNTSTFTLKDSTGKTIPATVTYSDGNRTATLTPTSALSNSTKYTATVSGVTDLVGNAISNAYSWAFTTAASTSTAPSDLSKLPLLQQSNLQYVGAFRVPTSQQGASTVAYGGTALAFNPANNSLFLVGHRNDQAIAEIAIPSKIVNSSSISSLTSATFLQPFTKITSKIPNMPSNLSSGGVPVIGGLMVSNGQLIGTMYNDYDASGSVKVSHFKLSSTNLSTASVSGLYQVGNMGGGFVAGSMTPIPKEWQSTLGATALTGQGGISIISRTSYGPAAFGFNPDSLGSGVNTATPYVYYDSAHPTLGAYQSNPPTLFNGTAGGFGTVFVPETRSVLVIGAIGTGNFYYGDASAANDPNRSEKGNHSVGGNYTWKVWAYDALDYAAVKNGAKNPWDVKPYATWNLNPAVTSGAKLASGATFDPATGRLYVSEMKVDYTDQYAPAPIISVYQVTTNAATTQSMSASASTFRPRCKQRP